MTNKVKLAALLAVLIMAAGCGNISQNENTDKNGIEVDGNAENGQSGESSQEGILNPKAIYCLEEGATRKAEISLIMVGDMLMHTPVEKSALQDDGSYSYDAIFANCREEIKAADLAIVNQEVIIGGSQLGISGYPCFNAPYELGHDLVEAGFDVICHGTNHTLDKGKKGVLNCMEFWKDNYPDVAVLGIHESQEAQEEIYIFEQAGIKVALLNFTYGTNGIAIPEGMPYLVDMMQEDKVVKMLKKANELADFVVVCPHWGTEYQLNASSYQKKWANIFLENGVDLVIGTHPHVIEPIEVLVDEETGNEMLVYYSIGNFVNWTSGTGRGVANRMVGGMAEITIGYDENNNVCITDYGVEAVVCHVQEGTNGVTVFYLDEYTQELAEANEIRKQDISFTLQYCIDLCDKVWGELWRD